MNRGRIISAAVAVVGVIGLGLSFLPWLTIHISDRLISMASPSFVWRYLVFGGESPNEYWEYACKSYGDYCPGAGGADISVTIFDFIASSYLAAAIIPIALILGVAAGALQAWRQVDTRVMSFLSLLSLSGLAVLTFTALDPSVVVSGTGDLGSTSGDVGTTDPGDLTLGVGPGLYLPAIILGLMFALTTWQAVVGLQEEKQLMRAGGQRSAI